MWNAVWFEEDEYGEQTAHYETLAEPKRKRAKPAPKKSKPLSKTVKTVKKKAVKTKTNRKVGKAVAKKTSEQAIFGRLNKILEELPQFVKITEVRHAYRARHHQDLKLSKTTRDRVLVKYDSRYENLVFHSKKRKLVVK